MAYKLLHAHGTAGANSKRSYLQFGTFKDKEKAKKKAKDSNLDGYRIVPESQVKKCTIKGAKKLVYVSK